MQVKEFFWDEIASYVVGFPDQEVVKQLGLTLNKNIEEPLCTITLRNGWYVSVHRGEKEDFPFTIYVHDQSGTAVIPDHPKHNAHSPSAEFENDDNELKEESDLPPLNLEFGGYPKPGANIPANRLGTVLNQLNHMSPATDREMERQEEVSAQPRLRSTLIG
jgi:hypothetical protein